jgi:hypothetical protein
MLYKKVTLWIKENSSVIALNYEKVSVTISGNFLVLSIHNEDSTEVTTEIHNLEKVQNWRTYIN